MKFSFWCELCRFYVWHQIPPSFTLETLLSSHWSRSDVIQIPIHLHCIRCVLCVILCEILYGEFVRVTNIVKESQFEVNNTKISCNVCPYNVIGRVSSDGIKDKVFSSR